MSLSVPVEVIVKNREQIDASSTDRVGDQLSKYEIQGNCIIDISVDDLAQQKWAIEAFGGIVGLGIETVMELRQNEDEIWQRPSDGEWTLRELTTNEALVPLGNSIIAIDAYGNALNLSDLVVDALRPLLLAADQERSITDQNLGWKIVASPSSTDSAFLEMERERASPWNGNFNAIVASLANSNLSTYVDPKTVISGVQQTKSLEKAWLIPDTLLIDRGQVEVQGKGEIKITYMMQQRLLDASVVMKLVNSFEYLSTTMSVVTPEQ